MTGEEWKILASSPMQKIYGKPRKKLQSIMQGYHPELCKYSRATRECYNDRCFRIHLKNTRHKQTPPATQEPSITHRTTNQLQAMIATHNLGPDYQKYLQPCISLFTLELEPQCCKSCNRYLGSIFKCKQCSKVACKVTRGRELL